MPIQQKECYVAQISAIAFFRCEAVDPFINSYIFLVFFIVLIFYSNIYFFSNKEK